MILAVDLGSTSFKAGVYEKNLSLRGESSYKLKYQENIFSNFALNSEDVTHGFKVCIEKSLESAGVSLEQLDAISITGQAQTFCLTNREFRPITPFISWRDTGSTETMEQLKKSTPWSNFFNHCSFPEIVTGLQVSSFLHLRRRDILPTSGDFLIMPLHSYLIFLLSGLYVTDDNMAAMTGFYSLSRRSWWPESLNYCELTPYQLPAVYPVGCIIAESAEKNCFGMPRGIKIIAAGNDQTVGAFGSGITETDIYLSLGTAYVAYGILKAMPEARASTARGFYYDGAFYRLAVADSGGNDLCKIVQQVSSGNFRDFFQRDVHDRKSVDALKKILEDIKSAALKIEVDKPQRLLVSGGGSRLPVFMQMLSEVTFMKTEIADFSSLDGAAILAARNALKKTYTQSNPIYQIS